MSQNNLPAISGEQNATGDMPLITTESADAAARGLSPSSIRLLERTYYPGASDEMIRLMHGFCVSRGVDHCQRPGYIVRAGGRESIWPSVHLYRVLAHRSMYAGTSKPEFGPEITLGNGIAGPEWVRMKIKRRLPDGSTAKFYAEAWLREFAKPTPQWRQMARHMLLIRCETIGLRAAFPEVGGMPTWEEVGDSEVTGADEPAPIQPPRRVTESADHAPRASETAGNAPAPAVEVVDIEPVEAAPATITPGVAKQIKARMAANGWGMDVLALALGREPSADLLDITRDEWNAAKPKLAEYAQHFATDVAAPAGESA